MRKESFEDDSDLIEACINRDLIAWAKLIKKYSDLIYVSIDSRLKKHNLALTQHDMEDIRQDILTSLWRDGKLQNIRNKKDISCWLAVVSGNMAIEHIRKSRAVEFKTVSIFDKIGLEKEFIEALPSPGPTASNELVKRELSRKIDEAIEALPIKQKLMIKLNILYGKTYYEIAAILNLPIGTVSSYLKRAREKLKDSLKDLASSGGLGTW